VILPIFLPNIGCKYKCKFCNQFEMTGEKIPSLNDLKLLFEDFKDYNPEEVAFYGGTFTGIPVEKQIEYLKLVKKYFPNVPIRISTRPDEINEEVINILEKYNVKTVELGIQSMYNEVLEASLRGHTVKDNIKAIEELLSKNFVVSAHLMIGLPNDSFEKDFDSLKKLIELNVKFFRIHPTIVFKNTQLEKDFILGKYRPLKIEEAVDICSEQLILAYAKKVKIIRLGYFVPESQKNQIVAGPYHPSFGDLVKAKAIRKLIKKLGIKKVIYPKKFESWFFSYGNKNIKVKRIPSEYDFKFDDYTLPQVSELYLKERKEKYG